MRRTRHALTPAVALVATLALSACGSDGADTTASTSSAAPASSEAPSSEAAAFNDTDVRFTQSMLPHHMQAVRNSEIEIAMGKDPEVKAVAQKILDQQLKEIETMRGFLEVFDAPEKAAPTDQQAVWDKNTADLRAAATPEERDVIFLTNMVPHHSAAVPMSQVEITLGSYQPGIELAMEIKQTQRMEIKEMNMMIRARTAAAG